MPVETKPPASSNHTFRRDAGWLDAPEGDSADVLRLLLPHPLPPPAARRGRPRDSAASIRPRRPAPPDRPEPAPRRIPERLPPAPEPEAAGVEEGIEDGSPEGVPGGDPRGVPGGQPGGDPDGVLHGGPYGGGAGPGSPPPEDPPLVLTGAIRPPERISFVAPEYPDAARLARVEGKVILEIVVDREGRVTDPAVLRGHPLFDAAAIAAVRTWRYAPALQGGRPVKVRMTIVIDFRLQ